MRVDIAPEGSSNTDKVTRKLTDSIAETCRSHASWQPARMTTAAPQVVCHADKVRLSCFCNACILQCCRGHCCVWRCYVQLAHRDACFVSMRLH